MSSGYFVLRRANALWAAPSEAVAAVEDAPLAAPGLVRDVRLRLVSGGALVADAVLGLRRDLAVRALGPVAAQWCPEAFEGVALCDGVPCVVIDTARPPRILSAVEEGG